MCHLSEIHIHWFSWIDCFLRYIKVHWVLRVCWHHIFFRAAYVHIHLTFGIGKIKICFSAIRQWWVDKSFNLFTIDNYAILFLKRLLATVQCPNLNFLQWLEHQLFEQLQFDLQSLISLIPSSVFLNLDSDYLKLLHNAILWWFFTIPFVGELKDVVFKWNFSIHEDR